MSITLDKSKKMEQAQQIGLNLVEIAKRCEALGMAQDFKEYIVSKLYVTDVITGPQACEMLGVPRRVFEGEVLAKHNFTAYGNSDEDVELEISRLTKREQSK